VALPDREGRGSIPLPARTKASPANDLASSFNGAGDAPTVIENFTAHRADNRQARLPG